MSFGHPKVLWVAAAILPLLALFLWATWRKRQALIRAFVQNKTLAQLTLGTSTLRQKLRRVLLITAVASLLLTMARPQWGFIWEEATQRGRDVIVAIDTSRSMLAEDIQPNRLTRAKLAALDLLKLGKFDRFGLVAFSGTAFLQCPLTFDDEAFRQSVQILQPGIIPQGGTALSEAIDSARRAFSEDADDNHRVLVLFTDGEDHEAGALETATRAADDGMRIFTVGVGSAAGELLRVRDESGNLNYVKDDAGNVVKSRLNEQLLKDIASKSGGFYLPLQGGVAMQVLYEKGLAPLPTTERSSKLMKRLKEQFYWPLGIAILLLVIEVFVPEQRKTNAEAPRSMLPASALSLLLILLCVPMAQAGSSKAQRHYNSGEYKSALSEYQELIGKDPSDPRLHYNAGASAYQANKFDEALKQFQSAAASQDIDLQQQSFYNLGNSEYRLGELTSNPQERIALWEQAVQHYEAALKIRPADKDSEFNRDFVRKKLEELKKQQQQEQDKNQNSEKDKKDENKDDKNNKDEQQKEDKPSEEQQKDNSQQNKQQDSQQQQQQQSNDNKQQEGQQKEPKEEKADSQQASQSGDKQSEQQEPKDEGQGQTAQLGKMTPAQAKQLLDAQKGEEKALIFIPPDRKSTGQNRTFKDW